MTSTPEPDDDDTPSPVRLFNESVSRVMARHPRLGRFSRFPVLALPDGVADTNGWRFRAGPKFADYTSEERDAIVLHEMLHVLLNHPARCMEALRPMIDDFRRWGSRDQREAALIARDLKRESDLHNNAADYVVNLLVCDAGETLPDSALLNPDYTGLGLSEVISRERGRSWQEPPPWGNDVAQPGTDGEEEGQAQQPGDGSQPGEGGDPSQQRAPGGFSSEEAESIIRAVTGRAPPIPVHVWLQRRLLRGTTKRNTWQRPSRFGSLVPGRKRHRGDVIVFCVDTSGSIDDTTQALFRRVAAGIPHAASTTVLFADTSVKATVDDIRNPDEVPHAWAHCAGGGGTDFDDALRQSADHNPSHVIYLTDGYGRRSVDGPGCPVTWIIYNETLKQSQDGVSRYLGAPRAGETQLFIDNGGHVLATEGVR